jgi:EAL domain-containing protein (putative c-di-GMP-specific phosphodiesterase class I)
LHGVDQKLGLITLTEGIETEDHRQALEEMGCDIGQGYLFSGLLPFNAVLDFLSQRP